MNDKQFSAKVVDT
jgi:hypothetical protein